MGNECCIVVDVDKEMRSTVLIIDEISHHVRQELTRSTLSQNYRTTISIANYLRNRFVALHMLEGIVGTISHVIMLSPQYPIIKVRFGPHRLRRKSTLWAPNSSISISPLKSWSPHMPRNVVLPVMLSPPHSIGDIIMSRTFTLLHDEIHDQISLPRSALVRLMRCNYTVCSGINHRHEPGYKIDLKKKCLSDVSQDGLGELRFHRFMLVNLSFAS